MVQAVSKGAFHRELAELRRKIATTQDEAGQYDDEMTQLKRQQQQLTVQLDQRQVPATPTHSDLASSVSVCLSVTAASCAKTTGPSRLKKLE